MATSVKQMMEAANAAVPRITPAQAREMIAKGNALVVDVMQLYGREAGESALPGQAAVRLELEPGLGEELERGGGRADAVRRRRQRPPHPRRAGGEGGVRRVRLCAGTHAHRTNAFQGNFATFNSGTLADQLTIGIEEFNIAHFFIRKCIILTQFCNRKKMVTCHPAVQPE